MSDTTTSAPATSSSSPAEPPVVELDATWLEVTIKVQCLHCGSTLDKTYVNPDPEPPFEAIQDFEIDCPTCKDALKTQMGVVDVRAIIPVAVLAGAEQMDELDDDVEEPAADEGTPPATPPAPGAP